MGDVISLTEPELGIWFCACDSFSFKLRSDGVAVCLVCGAEHDNRDAAKWCEDPEPELQPLPKSPMVVRNNGEIDFALNRTLRRIDAESTTAVIVVQGNGDVHGWGSDFTEADQRRWLVRRLREAYRLLTITR